MQQNKSFVVPGQLHVLAMLCLSAATAAADPSGPREESPSARVSNKLNPAISFNALLGASWRRADGSELGSSALLGPESGLRLDEAEVVLSSVVDPYLKADATIAFEEHEGEDGFGVDLEEVYVSALSMPRGLGARAGKMLLPFGRHNLLHRHMWPFIQAPLASQRIFGDEALNEVGVEASWLLPVEWYSQLLGVVADGRNELFEGADAGDLVFLLHFKNLVELSPAATLELGASTLWGAAADDTSSAAYGVNATYKWRPTRRGTYRSLEVQGELIHRQGDARRYQLDGSDEQIELDSLALSAQNDATGGYLHVRWQLERRWWLQGRYDRLEYDGGTEEARWSALAAFAPSEFHSLRLEYATHTPPNGRRDHQLLAQLGFTIGSHPAHAY